MINVCAGGQREYLKGTQGRAADSPDVLSRSGMESRGEEDQVSSSETVQSPSTFSTSFNGESKKFVLHYLGHIQKFYYHRVIQFWLDNLDPRFSFFKCILHFRFENGIN